jgi:hypothetical protein
MVATLIGGASTVYDYETAQRTAAAERQKSDRLLLSGIPASVTEWPPCRAPFILEVQ